jgi:hypothetical protein
MALKIQRPEPVEEPAKASPLTQKVADNVMKALGTPENFLFVKSCHLFENRFRVNIYKQIKTEFEGLIKKYCISDSFYCIVDEKGSIISPKIEKKY